MLSLRFTFLALETDRLNTLVAMSTTSTGTTDRSTCSTPRRRKKSTRARRYTNRHQGTNSIDTGVNTDGVLAIEEEQWVP